VNEWERPTPASAVRFPNNSVAVVPHNKETVWGALSGVVAAVALEKWWAQK